MARLSEELLPLILAQADEAGYRMEIIDGLGVWEAMPSKRHIQAEARIERSVRPDPQAGSDGGCHVYRDLYVRFANGSLRRPDVAIYCREPDEEDEFVTLVPEAVVEFVSRGSEQGPGTEPAFLPRAGREGRRGARSVHRHRVAPLP